MAALFWFTHDLRLADNPGLAAAARDHAEVIPLYILGREDPWIPSGASAWWLHHSLKSLGESIAAQGGSLILRSGNIEQIILELVNQMDVSAVYFSRAYEPWLAEIQQTVFTTLTQRGVTCKRFGSRLLLEPDQIFNQQGNPFQVFTPFYKHALKTFNFSSPINAKKVPWVALSNKEYACEELDRWALQPTKPNWAKSFDSHWRPGELGAKDALTRSLGQVVATYKDARDFPAQAGTSHLSPHLHFGEISPRQIWHRIKQHPQLSYDQSEPFLRQLIWREFNYYLLHHWPHIVDKPYKNSFANFPWRQDSKTLIAWKKGLTGYPIVDAGMRELWQTGWMHNRVRMIVASFLTKHLRIHWLEGAKWFWETLVDADLANNSAGWQWVAGSGADAAPYFRIFNPVLQSKKFDPEGEYIRKWIPELRSMPNKYIHAPWQAPSSELETAGIQLKHDYPMPIVDHHTARDAALEAYRVMKG